MAISCRFRGITIVRFLYSAVITSLVLRWHCTRLGQPHFSSEAEEYYDELWDFIASMLRLLEIWFGALTGTGDSIVHISEQSEFDEAWFEPMRSLRVEI